MLNNRQKRYVCTDYKQNEHGFTFITLLLAITILFVTIPLVFSVTKTITYSSNYQEISIQQFFFFLQDELLHATNLVITPTRLEFSTETNAVITIEQFQHLIRRRVDRSGHEVFLRDIKEALFTPLPYGFQVSITPLEGETYEKTIIVYP